MTAKGAETEHTQTRRNTESKRNTTPPTRSRIDTEVRISPPTDGECPGCGANTPQFMGKIYCDTCVESRLERESQAEAEKRLHTLCSTGLLHAATENARFTTAWNPGHNAQAWTRARESTRNLWLYGPAGVGKSHLARCILTDYILTTGKRAGEVSTRRVIKTAARFDEGRGIFELWEAVPVLLLDDIDKARWTEDALTSLWELLDTRNAEGHRTLVTANMAPADFGAFLRARVQGNRSLVSSTLDRLNPLDAVELTGRSLRATQGG